MATEPGLPKAVEEYVRHNKQGMQQLLHFAGWGFMTLEINGQEAASLFHQNGMLLEPFDENQIYNAASEYGRIPLSTSL